MEGQRTSRDIVAIEQVLNRYCHMLDRGDVDEVVELFTEDAVLIPEYEGTGEHAGRARVRSWYENYARTVVDTTVGLRHRISTPMIEVTGDTARAVCYLDADAVGRASGKRSLTGGRYEDELRRTPEGWRICRRRIVIDYASTID